MGLIQEVGFLPLLDSGIAGYSAEAIVDDECRYVVYSDGGWDWPLWKWKGPIVQEGGCVYGKFFAGKAGFVSREWWPDLCNWRRSKFPQPVEGSIEESILLTLAENGSLITRELRAACGFTGPNMRSKFDGYITRLQMAARIVDGSMAGVGRYSPRPKHFMGAMPVNVNERLRSRISVFSITCVNFCPKQRSARYENSSKWMLKTYQSCTIRSGKILYSSCFMHQWPCWL